MRPSWETFWKKGSSMACMFEELAPSELQRAFLSGLTPAEAPAIGLEISKRGLRRRPQMAAMVLSSRPQRWRALLNPLLQADGSFANGLNVSDLLPFIQPLKESNQWFEQAIWVEYTKPLRQHAGQPFLLFRRTCEPWTIDQLKKRLHQLHELFPTELQERLGFPSKSWWAALEALPLAGLDQLGLDISKEGGCWRFLFGVTQPQQLCADLGLATNLSNLLKPFPIGLALDSRRAIADRYSIEVFPHYRQKHSITSYPGEIPANASQWPQWPSHPALLPAKRLSKIMQFSVHAPSVSYGPQSLSMRGGLSHQKLVIESGEIIDHKAYVGVMVAAKRESLPSSPNPSNLSDETAAATHALTRLTMGNQWTGFALNPGASNRWVPLACLTLLAPWSRHPRLAETYLQQQQLLGEVLQNPRPIGYNDSTPADIDSSLWLRRYLSIQGRSSSPLLDAYLESGWRQESGITTYPDVRPISTYIKRVDGEMKGWGSSHDCVLANLASDSGLTNALHAMSLLRKRLKNKSFASFWWPLDGLMLSLLPRGSLRRSDVERVSNQNLAPAVEKTMPKENALALSTFSRCLMHLRHGTQTEQRDAQTDLDSLITSHENFENLLVMQLPDPECNEPISQTKWHWNGAMEGSLAPDPKGYLAAALLLAAQVRSK